MCVNVHESLKDNCRLAGVRHLSRVRQVGRFDQTGCFGRIAQLCQPLDPFRRAGRVGSSITFTSKSGPLTVSRDGERLAMDFPSIPPGRSAPNPELDQALGAKPQALFEGYQWLAVYESVEQVRALTPDFPALGKLPLHAVIVTARGRDCDFVSRFFAPSAGIAEDPVTGSAHSRLIPYWAKVLGKTRLHARQLSARGGELWCELKGERVMMAGQVAPYLEGTIEI